MIVQLSEQVQQQLGQTELVVITERVDDVVLLLGQMMRMGLPEVLDHHLPRHWKQEGWSWGWTATIWLAHILTEGDRRKVAMETYVKGMIQSLRQVTGQRIRVLDFSDDRLTHLLTHLRKAKHWHPIEHALNKRSLSVYDLPTEVVRCDATTVSAAHEVVDGGLIQFGHSKDDPTRPQLKVMLGALDPLGMPLATDVLSGERADDGLYIPLSERLQRGLNKPGLLFVGDCKMSALEIRAHVVRAHHHSLSPLPLTGTTAKEMATWRREGIAKAQGCELEPICRVNDQKQAVLVAQGYEIQRTCAVKDGQDTRQWQERVLVIHSPSHAEQQSHGLDKRLANAESTIRALTPPRGRGKRQMTEEGSLLEAIGKVLKAHRVEGLLTVAYVKETVCHTQYIGRGRGAAQRDQRVIEKVRYHITQVTPHDDQIAELKAHCGWQAFVTNATAQRLPLREAVLCYRHEYRIERIFNRLKSRLRIEPLFVKLDEQIQGLTYLLTLGVRVLSVMEFTIRRSLQTEHTQLAGLHPENRNKCTNEPTAERVLKAFSTVSLTIIKDAAGRELMRWLTPLSSVQQDILQRLGLDVSLYRQLEIQNTGNRLSE